MNLNAILKGIKEQFEQNAPAEIVRIMHDTTERLRNSGIMETALKVGDTVSDFTLPDTKERPVSLASCLANGPLVLTFFRGQW